jgi:hypothetical protein
MTSLYKAKEVSLEQLFDQVNPYHSDIIKKAASCGLCLKAY